MSMTKLKTGQMSFVRPDASFTLFVHRTDACNRILKLVEDTEIYVVNITNKNKVPQYVQGVPSLCDNNQRTVYQGRDAFRVIEAIKKELRKEMQRPSSLHLSVQQNAHAATAVPGMTISNESDGPITEDMIEQMLKQRDEMLNPPAKIQ